MVVHSPPSSDSGLWLGHFTGAEPVWSNAWRGLYREGRSISDALQAVLGDAQAAPPGHRPDAVELRDRLRAAVASP